MKTMSALDVVKENMLLTIASGASIVIAIYVYRFYKKVREYPPGPFPLPVIGNLHQLDASNTHKGIERFSLQYGPVFTVFFPHPTIVVVGLPELREALIKQGDNFSGRFTAPMSEIFMSMANGGVIFASGENWRDQRRFSVHALRDFGMGRNVMEQKILDSTTTLIEQLDHNLTEIDVVDMNWPLQLCVGNIINDLLLGYHWKAENCEKYKLFKGMLDRIMYEISNRTSVLLVHAYPWLKHVPFIGYIGYWQLRKDVEVLQDFMLNEIREHKKVINFDSEPTDIVGAYLIEMNKREKTGDMGSFSERQLVNVLTDFWIAGMETTATTLRWAILYLMDHPDIQEKMYAEVEDVIGRDRMPAMVDKTSMPYTSALILEVQRYANIVPFPPPRMTITATTIGGQHIPPNATILPMYTSVLDSPSVFPDPHRFDPTRFLEDDGKTLKKSALDSMVGFGMGKRQCAGEPLARMELFLILVALVQRYRFEIADSANPPDMTPVFGATMPPRPHTCKIIHRK